MLKAVRRDFAVLWRTIKYLESQIPKKERGLETPKQIVDERISRFELSYGINKPTDKKPMFMDVFMVNKGEIPADQPTHTHAALFLDGEVEIANIDQIFAALIEGSKPMRSLKATNQIYPNTQGNYWSIDQFIDDKNRNFKMDEAQYKMVTDGTKRRLYVFVLLQYRDKLTPANKWRTTEGCFFLLNSGAARLCDSHNGPGLTD